MGLIFISDLKVYRCLCGKPMKIKKHENNLFILNCNYCDYEVSFCDDHIYFNHPSARTKINDFVIFEAFK